MVATPTRRPDVTVLMYAADAAAILILILLFVRRHGRRDSSPPSSASTSASPRSPRLWPRAPLNAGLGLGLFGVLSIIRLRSEELAEHEIAYYFAALALGLIGGLSITPTALHLALTALIVVALWVGDHALVARPTSRQEVLLDCGFTDGVELRPAGAPRIPVPDRRPPRPRADRRRSGRGTTRRATGSGDPAFGLLVSRLDLRIGAGDIADQLAAYPELYVVLPLAAQPDERVRLVDAVEPAHRARRGGRAVDVEGRLAVRRHIQVDPHRTSLPNPPVGRLAVNADFTTKVVPES
jgi:hypothetical protein